MVRYSTGKKSPKLNPDTTPDGAFINSAKEFMEIMDREVRDELDHFGMFGESIETKRRRESLTTNASGDSPKGMRTEKNPVGQHLLRLLAENAIQSQQIIILQNMVRARDYKEDGSRKNSDRELFSWMTSLRETQLNKQCLSESPSGETSVSDSSNACAEPTIREITNLPTRSQKITMI